MNILVSTFRYFSLTGTETFTYTLLKTLSAIKEYRIFFWSPFMDGEILRQTKKLNRVFIARNIEELARQPIDLIHVHHNLTAILLRHLFPQTPMVYLMHGPLPFLEQPPDAIKCNYYGGLSPEIDQRLHLHKIPKPKRFIFPNSIDTERFCPVGILPAWPHRLLVLTNYLSAEAQKMIRTAARQTRLTVAFAGRSRQRFDVETAIRKADIVMSLGRGAIEAMACGKAVLVFANDGRNYTAGDGMLTKDKVAACAQTNFSGRSYRIPFTVKNLVTELQKYDPAMGAYNRQFADARFDFGRNLPLLTDIYRKAAGEKALPYDTKSVDFIARGVMELLGYEKLVYRYRNLRSLLFTRFKDQLIQR